MQEIDIIKALGDGIKLSSQVIDEMDPATAGRFHGLRNSIKECVLSFSKADDLNFATDEIARLANIYKDNKIKVSSGVFCRDAGEKLNDPEYKLVFYNYLSDLLVNGCLSLDKTHQIQIESEKVTDRQVADSFGFDVKAEKKTFDIRVGYFYVLIKSGLFIDFVDLSRNFFDKNEWGIVVFDELYDAALRLDEPKVASLSEIAVSSHATIAAGKDGIDFWTALSNKITGNDIYGIATEYQRKVFSEIAEMLQRNGIGPGCSLYENLGRGIETLIRNGYVEVIDLAGADAINSLNYTNKRGESFATVAQNVQKSINWVLVERDGISDYANDVVQKIDSFAEKLSLQNSATILQSVNCDPSIDFDTF